MSVIRRLLLVALTIGFLWLVYLGGDSSTTTTTVPTLPGVVVLTAADPVIRCSFCTVTAHDVLPYLDANGTHSVVIQDIVVDGTTDSGPIQSGTVNVRGADHITLVRVHVSNSPRSCFSLEGSTHVTLDSVVCEGADHLGIHAGHVSFITIINSELSDFSRRNIDLGWESGGIKLTNGRNILIEGNYIHDGSGPGIWLDIHVDDATILENTVSNLSGEGIFVEISTNVVVQSNTVTASPNGLTMSRMNWCYGAGILISTSFDVVVLENTVSDALHGIIVLDQSWRDDTPQGYTASNYLIAHNTVQRVDKTGACEDVGRSGVFEGSWHDNTFQSVASLLPPIG